MKWIETDDLIGQAVDHISRAIQHGTDAGTRFSIALSGGRTPWAVFERLVALNLPWTLVDLYQVDERVAPPEDPDRNLFHLKRCGLWTSGARVFPMPVDDPDLEAASDRYAQLLPARLGLVHLGLGADGHTASLVGADPIVEVTDRLVGMTTKPYQGRRRMTLTRRALDSAEAILWLVGGEDKRAALTRLRAGDRTIPSGMIAADHATLITDVHFAP